MGGDGNDVLIGGLGKDTLVCGFGYDDFAFDFPSEIPAGAGRDFIEDFRRGSDLIDLELMDPNASAGDQDFAFRGTGVFTGDDQVRYFHTAGGNTIIQGNTDANIATVEFEIELAGRHNLTTADFDL
jgi:Ca2+-binding RTX toxin-like protein